MRVLMELPLKPPSDYERGDPTTVRLDPVLKAALTRIAKEYDMSFSRVLNWACRRYVMEHEKR